MNATNKTNGTLVHNITAPHEHWHLDVASEAYFNSSKVIEFFWFLPCLILLIYALLMKFYVK